ncbi:hypothetical protein EPO15_10365 [bacterium]|nr:MAG: hypothetical protein EPO15_10365 [bacterium]
MTSLFAAASLVNAVLLFLVQPMTAKALLPAFGGTAAVWTTCMLFYQALLLGGYYYAHRLGRLPPRAQAAVHLALFAVAAFALPPLPPAGWAPAAGAGVGTLLLALARAAALPFLVLAAGAPLLQRWFARAGGERGRDPYFLYAASNVGSFLSLLAYPFAVEPRLSLPAQARLWSWGFGLTALVWAVCARSASGADALPEPAERSSWRERLLWVVLAGVPSSLMLGVTSHLTVNIAPVPLLWVVPLAVYLATYVGAFSSAGPAVTAWCALAAPLMGLSWAFSGAFFMGTWPQILLHLGVLAVLAGALHGRLAASRPPASRLTEFYLCAAAGGVAGGLFNGLFAPLAFSGLHEYACAVVAAMALLPDEALPPRPEGDAGEGLHWSSVALRVSAATLALTMLGEWPWPGQVWARVSGGRLGPEFFDVLTAVYRLLVPGALAYHLARRPADLRAAFGVMLAVVAARQSVLESKSVVERQRNFYGVLTVKRHESERWMTLTHGDTIHGRQSLDPARRAEPLTYFHPTGPAADVFAAARAFAARRFAVVGLGAGTLAAYLGPGDELAFYELDPDVERFARKHFSYLADAEARGAKVTTVAGDARLSLNAGGTFDLLVVDAFSSDSIPVHLVTREAVQLYRRRLSPKGLMAFHVTNRHLRLARAFARLAAEEGLYAARRKDDDSSARGKNTSEWVVLAQTPEGLTPLAKLGTWQGIAPVAGDPLWTDDFSSLLPLLK